MSVLIEMIKDMYHSFITIFVAAVVVISVVLGYIYLAPLWPEIYHLYKNW